MSRTILSVAVAIFVALTTGCAANLTTGPNGTSMDLRWVAPTTPAVFYYGDYPVYYEHHRHYYVVEGRREFLPPEIAERCVLRGGRCARR